MPGKKPETTPTTAASKKPNPLDAVRTPGKLLPKSPLQELAATLARMSSKGQLGDIVGISAKFSPDDGKWSVTGKAEADKVEASCYIGRVNQPSLLDENGNSKPKRDSTPAILNCHKCGGEDCVEERNGPHDRFTHKCECGKWKAEPEQDENPPRPAPTNSAVIKLKDALLAEMKKKGEEHLSIKKVASIRKSVGKAADVRFTDVEEDNAYGMAQEEFCGVDEPAPEDAPQFPGKPYNPAAAKAKRKQDEENLYNALAQHYENNGQEMSFLDAEKLAKRLAPHMTAPDLADMRTRARKFLTGHPGGDPPKPGTREFHLRGLRHEFAAEMQKQGKPTLTAKMKSEIVRGEKPVDGPAYTPAEIAEAYKLAQGDVKEME